MKSALATPPLVLLQFRLETRGHLGLKNFSAQLRVDWWHFGLAAIVATSVSSYQAAPARE